MQAWATLYKFDTELVSHVLALWIFRACVELVNLDLSGLASQNDYRAGYSLSFLVSNCYQFKTSNF